MAYEEITNFNSPNYTPNSQVLRVFGYPRTIVGVVYHWWGDPNSRPTFEGVIGWLCRANGNSSAHVVGEGGRVAWIVNAIDAAWHAGDARGNAQYVGYECNPRLSDADYETMGEFHYNMEKAYKRTLEIRVHKEFSSTTCSPIDKPRIRAIADRLHHAAPAPAPTPAPVATPWVRMNNPRKLRAKVDLRVINLTNNQAVGNIIKAGTEIDFLTKKNQNNITYLRSKYSTEKNLNHGIDIRNLEEIPVPAPATSEWIRNLKTIEAKKMSVLPAAGTKVINMTTGVPINDNIVPKGTQIDVVATTTVGGVEYYISQYARQHNVSSGLLASDLGVPKIDPAQEKPEWFRNLKDIEDQDFWTRSKTPVLNLADGSTAELLPINTKVRVTHATEIVGIKLLVLEGQKKAIETVYLSDTEIENPYKNLDQRVSILEKIVKAVVDFLSGLFKNFTTKN